MPDLMELISVWGNAASEPGSSGEWEALISDVFVHIPLPCCSNQQLGGDGLSILLFWC